MNYINTNIKVLRTEARLSIEEFAEKMEVSIETVKLWEKGKLEPTDSEITKMCPILRIHKEDFLERDILSERNSAGVLMKKGQTRKTYDWYYGNKLVMSFYVSYLILIPVVLLLTYLVTDYIFNDILDGLEMQAVPVEFYQAFYMFIVSGFVSAIYVLIYVFRNGIIKFQYWYLWWITPFMTILTVVSGIATILLYIYAIYKGLILKGKNR